MEENQTESVESIADALAASFNEHSTDSEPETEEVEEIEAVEAEAETVEVEEDGTETLEPETVFQAPEHWSSDEQEKFAALSPEAQELVLERDKEYQRGYQEKAETISAITEALEPWKDELAQRGVTADQAIRALFAAQHQLDSNPIQGILQIAASYGVEDQVREYFSPKTDDDDFADPEVKALRQQISQLQQQVQQTQHGIQQQQTSNTQGMIESFKNERVDGELAHPYFDQVKMQMAPLVQQGKSLKEAYDEVVWTVPEYREAQAKRNQEDELSKQRARVKKAKTASRSVKTDGKAPVNEGEQNLSLAEDLRLSFQQHSS